MKQTFTKYNAKNTNSSGRAVLRQGTLRRSGAVPPTGSTFCRSGVSRKTKAVRRDDTSCLAGTLRRPDAVPPTSRSVCHVLRIPAFILLLAVCCVSCRNVIEAPEETAEIAESGGGEGATGKLYTLSGAVGAGGAVPSSFAANSRSAAFGDTGGGIENGVCGDTDGTATQSGRAAAANARSATYSSGQLTGVSYTVTATTVRSPDSDKNPPGTEKTVDATAAEDGSHRFYIELLEGTYTLSVEGFLGEGDGKKKILEGTYRNADTNNKVVIGPESSPDNCNILVHPIFDGGGTGTVNLTLSMAADCNIKCLKAVWEADETQKTKTFTNGGNALTTALFTMTADDETDSDIPAGFHRVDFYFYGDEGGTDELYSCTQYLNVFENLTTDLWRNNGATPYIDDDGNFTLTRSVIYNRKLFYVQNRNDSKKGEGTRYSPFDSVQTAVQKILAANDGTSEYKIALLSDDTDESTSSYTADTSRSYICINPDKPLKLIIESDVFESRDTNGGNPFTIDAARTADKTGRVMYIGKNAEVTLNNIKITGGNIAGYSGGGIENASENLKLSRVTIFDCTTTGYGGGIRSTGTLTMTDCTLTNCTADNGGGVSNHGTLTVSGGTISDCSVSPDSSGGSNGGGVYNAGTLTMGGVSITNCTTAVGGGGIYNFGNSATATITDCTITGCKSTSQTYGGGGIFIHSGTLELTDCTITGGGDIANPDATNGGGIYNNTGGTLRMTGGSVINCTASATDGSKGGGGIFSSGTLVISGVTVSGCEATSFGGGILVAGTSAENAVTDCTITGCMVKGTTVNNVGGGIYVSGKLTVTGGTISGCEVKNNGGGVFVRNGGSAEIKGCSISNCRAMNGGGINNQGTLTVSEGTSVSNCTGMGVVYNWGTLTVTGSTTISGGTNNACGIYNSRGSLTVDGCTISNCTYSFCGGIYITSSSTSANISNCTISDCHALTTSSNVGRGGGINNECAATEITGCTITNCTATYDGGGIYNNVTDASAVTKIENCEISGCKALGTNYSNYHGGGGIYNNAGKLELTDVNITGGNDTANLDALNGGGGIYNKGTLTVTRGTISNCTAKFGGGIFTIGNGASFSADGTKILSCTSNEYGGGMYSDTVTASAALKDCIIQSCTAKSNSTSGGGGIYHRYGELIITGGEISRCTSNGGGGGIDMQQDSTSTKKTVITGTKFSECRSRFHGGGLSIHNAIATVELTDCTVESCEVTDTNYGGGGISVLNGFVSRWTYVTVENCSVKSCTASFGSGIFNSDSNGDTLLTLKDSEVSGDVSARYKGSHLSLSGSTTVTDGAIDLSVYTSPTNSSVQIAGALSKSSVAKIKLGTAYAAGDTILTSADASVYALTAEDCNRFTIDGAYGIAYSGGNGVLVSMPIIYLNSESGSDTNSGGTAANAVATLSKALELFDQKSAQKIMVCAAYTLPSGESSLLDRTGKRKAVLVRYDGSSDVSGGFTGAVLTISSGTVTLKNITLDGNKDAVTAADRLLTISGSTTVVTLGADTTVCNNEKSSRGSGVYIDSGTFKMADGTITGNVGTSGYGPAVYINDSGTFEMTGGVISGNDAGTGGFCGNVYVRGSFVMSGGEISGNSGGDGGGVYVTSYGSFTMSGGKIINNTSSSYGGGVYNNGTFTMSAGEITGNTASISGSGVYTTSSGTFTKTGGTVQSD